MKKRPERRKHCELVVEGAAKNFRPATDPLPGLTAKIQSAGDVHYLHLQTQFGEDRCTNIRVIMVTDTTRPLSQTHRQDRLQYTAPQLASAQCNNRLISEQPYIHARWSIFTFLGHNEPRPGHGTLWVNSGTIPAIPGWLASLLEYSIVNK